MRLQMRRRRTRNLCPVTGSAAMFADEPRNIRYRFRSLSSRNRSPPPFISSATPSSLPSCLASFDELTALCAPLAAAAMRSSSASPAWTPLIAFDATSPISSAAAAPARSTPDTSAPIGPIAAMIESIVSSTSLMADGVACRDMVNRHPSLLAGRSMRNAHRDRCIDMGCLRVRIPIEVLPAHRIGINRISAQEPPKLRIVIPRLHVHQARSDPLLPGITRPVRRDAERRANGR